MFKHLIYKEWLKTWRYAAVALLIGLAVAVYVFADIRGTRNATGAAFYYSSLILEKPVLARMFIYVPIVSALLIGLSQFLPEVADKRIKLTFHLPLPPVKALYCMVGYGFALMACVTVLPMLLTCALLSSVLPWEFVHPVLQTLWPWCLGGISCYCFIAMIALEPQWKYRVADIIWVYFVLRIFFGSYGLGNAVTVYPFLYALTAVAGLSVIYTANRFNKGGC